MAKIKVFLDTDVVISSLLSKTGASHEVINSSKIEKFISKQVKKEVLEVSKRYNISTQEIEFVFKNTGLISLKISKKSLINDYGEYVSDEQDTHVVFGALKAKVKFLLTHNTKHYNIEKIRKDLDLQILKPGNFLQYLRSKNKF